MAKKRKKSSNETPSYMRYANDVINGNIKVCNWVKLACERFISDLKRSDLQFNSSAVDRCISFIAGLKHTAGKSAGKNFILEPWQQFIVANIVGFEWASSGDRRFTNSYIEISRKNGKTALAAALCLYFLFDEIGAEVDLAANSKQQAHIAFDFCSAYAKQLDPKKKHLKILRDSVEFGQANSKINVFSSDDTKLDGFGGSFICVDEYHSAANSKLRDVLKSGQGFRQNPHLMTITTAGFNKHFPCYQLRTVCTEILQGLKTDDATFAVIYTLDEGDEWTDKTNWKKSNPNLNVTVTDKYLSEQVTSAINNPSEEVGVKTKNLNVWCDSVKVWIPDTYIYNVSSNVNLDDFKETDCNVFSGIDLAAVSDMTTVSYLIDDFSGVIKFKTDFYLPESALTESPNRELYKYWLLTKQLKITDGNVTDYDYILNDLMHNFNNLCIQKIGYDNWNSTSFAISATDAGLPLEPYSQSIGNFNKPTRELERLIKQGKCLIDNNEIIRWMFKNVALKSDWNGNVKPNKGSGKDKKIDGIISMIEALGVYLDTPKFSGGIMAI